MHNMKQSCTVRILPRSLDANNDCIYYDLWTSIMIRSTSQMWPTVGWDCKRKTATHPKAEPTLNPKSNFTFSSHVMIFPPEEINFNTKI